MFRGKGYFCHIRCHESNCSKCYCPFKHSGETDTSKDILTAVNPETFVVTDEMRALINKELQAFKEKHDKEPTNEITTSSLDLSIPGDQTYAATAPNLSLMENQDIPVYNEENGTNYSD